MMKVNHTIYLKPENSYCLHLTVDNLNIINMFDILYIAHTAESGQREPPRLVLEVGWDFKVPSGPTQLAV